MEEFRSKFLCCAALFLVCFLNPSLAGPHGGHSWCYKDPHCGVRVWEGMCQKGKVQSPIDFNSNDVKQNRTQMKLRLNEEYLETQDKFFIKNNGHTAQIQLEPDLSSKLILDGDGLKGSYVFSQFHFHWGSNDSQGSEHTVNGTAYPLELHLVHYNDMFKGLGEAVAANNHRSLLVLGIFFKLSPNDNPALKPIIDALSDVEKVSDENTVVNAKLNVSSFLPNQHSLYRYYGSLTTPSCFEVVHWNVFKTPVPVSESQLEAFRKLKDGEGSSLVDNFRPTLPLAGRKVVEYDVVELQHKPQNGEQDTHKLFDDSDYADGLGGGVESKKSPGDKRSSGATTRSISYSLLFGFALFMMKQLF